MENIVVLLILARERSEKWFSFFLSFFFFFFFFFVQHLTKDTLTVKIQGIYVVYMQPKKITDMYQSKYGTDNNHNH